MGRGHQSQSQPPTEAARCSARPAPRHTLARALRTDAAKPALQARCCCSPARLERWHSPGTGPALPAERLCGRCRQRSGGAPREMPQCRRFVATGIAPTRQCGPSRLTPAPLDSEAKLPSVRRLADVAVGRDAGPSVPRTPRRSQGDLACTQRHGGPTPCTQTRWLHRHGTRRREPGRAPWSPTSRRARTAGLWGSTEQPCVPLRGAQATRAHAAPRQRVLGSGPSQR